MQIPNLVIVIYCWFTVQASLSREGLMGQNAIFLFHCNDAATESDWQFASIVLLTGLI